MPSLKRILNDDEHTNQCEKEYTARIEFNKTLNLTLKEEGLALLIKKVKEENK